MTYPPVLSHGRPRLRLLPGTAPRTAESTPPTNVAREPDLLIAWACGPPVQMVRGPVALFLFRAEEAVAGVPEAGHDITVIVELVVDGGGKDRHVGMRGPEGHDALGRGDETDIFEGPDPAPLEAVQRGDRRVGGGEHRVDDDHVTLRDVVRHLEIVLDGRERLGIAIESDMADARRRYEVEHAFENAAPGPQHRDNAELLAG